jgi:hypothetical protein
MLNVSLPSHPLCQGGNIMLGGVSFQLCKCRHQLHPGTSLTIGHRRDHRLHRHFERVRLPLLQWQAAACGCTRGCAHTARSGHVFRALARRHRAEGHLLAGRAQGWPVRDGAPSSGRSAAEHGAARLYVYPHEAAPGAPRPLPQHGAHLYSVSHLPCSRVALLNTTTGLFTGHLSSPTASAARSSEPRSTSVSTTPRLRPVRADQSAQTSSTEA